MKQSRILAQKVQAISDFREAYQKLLDMMEAHEQNFQRSQGPRSLASMPPYGPETEEQRRRVGELSGSAALAGEEAGTYMTLPPGLGMQVVSPIRTWSTATDRGYSPVRPQDVLDACNQSIGVLSAREAEAEAREKSLAGRVARILRFPYDVSEFMGLPPGSRGGKVAFWVVVVIEAIGGALAIGIVAVVTRLTAALVDAIG